MASQDPKADSPSVSKTNAQLLQERHEAVETRNPTVEDAIDEDHIRDHSPPPSHLPSDDLPSSHAADKQKAKLGMKKSTVLDTRSEESFPALGGGPKIWSTLAAAPAWGAREASPSNPSAANGARNGQSPNPSASTRLSSRASTPPLGILTPASSATITHAYTSGRSPLQMAMPGKYTDSITLLPAQIDKNKPIQPYLDKLNKQSRATVTRHTARDGSSIVFEGSGPKKDVSEALRTIARELCAKQKIRLPIPASCRAPIIGQGGKVIRDISARTGANITVSKLGITSGSHEDDDCVTVDVEIEGDPYAVELARLDIDKIVSARTSKANLRLKNIPPEFFPFLAGPHNSRIAAMQQARDLQIQVPHFETWQHMPPPRVSSPSERPNFQPHPEMHVRISGDRMAVQDARAQIEHHVEQLRRQLAAEDHSFPRGHHQFIVGERGMSLHDFLAETGCTVVLPPEHDDTEDITIIGPLEQLQVGIDKAATLAAEMQMANVDPRRYFADAPLGPEAHSRALARYLQARQLEAEIDGLYGARLNFPPLSDPSLNWEIYSRDMKKSIQARADLTKIIQAHPPAKLALVEVDSFFHPHLRQRYLHVLQSEYGVNMVFPRSGESGHVVLVCERPEVPGSTFQIPRQRPAEPEILTFQDALRKARSELLRVVGDNIDIATTRAEVPKRFHAKVRRYVDQERQQPLEAFPVQVQLGIPDEGLQDPASILDTSPSANIALLRGLRADVAILEAQIVSFVEQLQKDELERSYKTTFEFPSKFNGYLIGREGVNIRELRDQFDVEINPLDDGKIEIKGPKAKAEVCKDHIVGLRKRYEDEASYFLKIEPKFHGKLVGRKGADVNRLQDKYNVKIQFPLSSHQHDDQSSMENGSDAGGRRSARSVQAQDEVLIRGPRQGADRARAEILDLYQYAKDNSHCITISVARQHLGSLIGQRGGEIERLRLETGAQIDFPERQAVADPTAHVEVTIKGTKEAVVAAKSEIEVKVGLLEDSVTQSLDVDSKYHGALIGAYGANIKRIVHDAGGLDQSRPTVKFPGRGSESNTIRVEGPRNVVTQVTAAIEKFVLDQENQVTDAVDVPPEKHRHLIGPRGEAKRSLEQRFNVTLEIPKKGSDRRDIQLTGTAEDVAKAKQYLAGLADERNRDETVEVPAHLHHSIAANGKLFRQLKADHGVTVDHGGTKAPSGSKGANDHSHTKDNSAPLITDEDSVGAHSWVVIPAESIEGDDGSTIPWILSGPSAEKVAAAMERVRRALERAAQPCTTCFLTLSDPSYYRFVVGPGGKHINSIRERTGCTIQVPDARSGKEAESDAIGIWGTAEGCEQAKKLVLEAVKNGVAR